MVTTHETHEKAKEIIQDALETQFQGKVHFHEIRITARPGADDDEYLDVQAIYTGKPSDLDPRLLNSLYATIEDDLRAIGIETVPSISYREKTEDSEWSKPVGVSPPKEQT